MDSTRDAIVRGILCAGMIVGCANAACGHPFAGGAGKPEDPYRIATAEQLLSISSVLYWQKSHFVLAASIDLSGTVRSLPLMSSFGGSFDGNGHTIRGLTARGLGSQGLFGQILKEGRVMNLQLEDVHLAGTESVGGLAALNSGIVSNCHITGRVLGIEGGDAGGLVGSNAGTITDSSSAADVSGVNRVGGLAGYNQGGALLNCRSTAIVFGTTYVGGLVGSNEGSIAASYSDSEVAGRNALGGLVGSNAGDISACYSAGFVTGRSYVGGLVGANEGRIFTCYSVASVPHQATSYTPSFAALVGGGSGIYSNPLRNCYFLAPADGGGPDNKIGTPLTAAQLKQQSSFFGWDFWETPLDGSDDAWFMPADGFPVLAWQTEVTGLQRVPDVTGLPLGKAQAALIAAGFVPGNLSHDFHRTLASDHVVHAYPGSNAPAGGVIDLVLSSGGTYNWADNPGDGTAANPHQIQTAGQLESLIDHAGLWDKHFVLTTDLDMAGRTYSKPLIAWSMTSGRTGAMIHNTPFSGTFDGQGHTIRNLSIAGEGSGNYLGLFGVVDKAGRVGNIRLANAHVISARTSWNYVGALAAYNDGTLVDCSVVGSIVVGSTSWDGLVGINHGDVINCYVDGVLASSPGFRR